MSLLPSLVNFLLFLWLSLVDFSQGFSVSRPLQKKFVIHPPQNHRDAVLLSMTSTAASSADLPTDDSSKELTRFQSKAVKAAMMAYVVSMCVALPVTLLPQKMLYKMRLLNQTQREKLALKTAQRCARYLLKVIPFCRIQCRKPADAQFSQPSVWVCNHTSMLDIFLLLAADKRARGRQTRPIKIIYWKGLESNPITKLLFRQAGFIAVEMADNGNGNDNDYDKASFKALLQQARQAFDQGFDIGILPEGQLNPTPEEGLLPIFGGAFSLARMSRRPIHMMALHGAHKLWHPIHGMKPQCRNVSIRVYETGRTYQSKDDFVKTFQTVVGHFGAHGTDHHETQEWLDGTMWNSNNNNHDEQEALSSSSSSSSSLESASQKTNLLKRNK